MISHSQALAARRGGFAVRSELFVGWRYLKAKTKMACIPVITFISVAGVIAAAPVHVGHALIRTLDTACEVRVTDIAQNLMLGSLEDLQPEGEILDANGKEQHRNPTARSSHKKCPKTDACR